jgi:DNA excision repair protein ERCC-2
LTIRKKISLAVSKFAQPAPLRGSIDGYSGLGRGQEIGQEIHRQIQSQRKQNHSHYKSEVYVKHIFKCELYDFEVCGKMDGLFDAETICIEEIKTSFNTFELQKRLKENPEHPYLLQLRTYGYMHWLQNNYKPDLTLLLVSSRNNETFEMKIPLDVFSYENWLKRRLEELVIEAAAAEKRSARRKKASGSLVFPFPKPRKGQIDLIETIEQGLKEKQVMLLQAPTGLGKTIGVLYPTLRESLSRGQRVIYATPKNSQHAVAEDAIERFQGSGGSIKGMTLTAKSKMCFKNEAICNPDFCEYANDHYTKISENNVIEKLHKKKKLTSRVFRKIAEEFQVCPFEIQLDAAVDADAIICDYNYVFGPRSPLGRINSEELDQKGKPNLVIDEAHNMPSRTMDYYSPSLSVRALEVRREESGVLPKKFRNEFESLVNQCIATVKNCAPKDKAKACKISIPLAHFLETDSEIRNFLSTYLSSDTDIQPGDPVLSLSFYWSQFTEALEYVGSGRKEFFTTYDPTQERMTITCCDASELLQEYYENYEHVVGFSATLKPFDYYSQLSGMKNQKLKTAEFVSPFSRQQRKLLIIPQVSTKYSERQKNYPRIAEAIHRIASLKKGNYFAFFPSFDFLNRVLDQFKLPEGFEVLKQRSGMSRDDIDNILEQLKESSGHYIVFAVQGGVFSEGVDYPGKMAIGAFVVGPPLPTFDLVREEMRNYYEENYKAGFDYAYTYPAMAKAVQAAGRVIRTEADKGIIILMDDRFIQPAYTKSMPLDWFDENANELVSKNILKDLSDFWKSESNK